jgi:hypothetical protein
MKPLVPGIIGMALLAGCAQVPTSGPVVEVDQAVPDVASTSFVRALARPPRVGMSQTEIVQGFLDAASGFEDAHAVAKLYLTPAAARQWDPDAGSRVYGNGTETLTATTQTEVTFTATQVAAISDRAQYIPARPDTAMTQRFGLVQVDGQWRIADPPDGLLLSRAAVERSYREFQTYFVAEPGGILAPNPVLFQSSQSDVTEALVRSLLAGPGAWLAPAVITGFPEGTQLASVSTADGIVRVDLSEQAQQADDVARQQLSAQLLWTLRQVPSMRGVVITAGGQPFPVAGTEAVQPRGSWPQFNPDGLVSDAPWYLVRSGAVLSMSAPGTVAAPVPGAAGVGEPPIRHPVISLDQTAVAATDRSPEVLTARTEAGARWRPARTTATSAGGSWDRTGLLWLPDGASGAQVVTVLGSRDVPLRLPDVRSVQVSRDGTRVVVVAGPADDARAYLLRVDRSTGPPTVSAPRQLPTGPVRAAAWASATQVALLVEDPGQPAQVATVDLGLFSVRLLGGPPRARSVAAGPGRPLLSGTADGQIWQFNGSTWVPLVAGRQPRYPG